MYLRGFSPVNAAWTIKGTKEGSTLRFPSGQFLGSRYDSPFYLTAETADGTPAEYMEFTLTPENIYESNSRICFSDKNYNYTWFDGATLSQLPLPELVKVPVSARPHLYTMAYKGYIQSIGYYYDSSMQITVAVNDDKIYIKGLYYGVPDAWIEGDIIDGKAVFKSTQYLGHISDMYPELYFMAFGDNEEESLDRLEFDYDKTTGALFNASANKTLSVNHHAI